MTRRPGCGTSSVSMSSGRSPAPRGQRLGADAAADLRASTRAPTRWAERGARVEGAEDRGRAPRAKAALAEGRREPGRERVAMPRAQVAAQVDGQRRVPVVEEIAAERRAAEARAQQDRRVLEAAGGETKRSARTWARPPSAPIASIASTPRPSGLRRRRAATVCSWSCRPGCSSTACSPFKGEKRESTGQSSQVAEPQQAGRPCSGREGRACGSGRKGPRCGAIARSIGLSGYGGSARAPGRCGPTPRDHPRRRARDPEGLLGPAVVGQQVLERERPIHHHPVAGAHPEVGRREARRRAGPMQGRAADAVDVAPRVGGGAGRGFVVVPGAGDVGFPVAVGELFGVGLERAPLEHRHPQAGLQRLPGGEQTADAGADDREVRLDRLHGRESGRRRGPAHRGRSR